MVRMKIKRKRVPFMEGTENCRELPKSLSQ